MVTREKAECKITIEEEEDVSQIRKEIISNQLVLEISRPLFFFDNQIEKIDENKRIKDVVNSGDTVTIYIGDAPPSKGMLEKRDKFLKRITNKSGGKVMIVLKTKLLGEKRSFPEEKWDAVDFSKWRNEVELCW